MSEHIAETPVQAAEAYEALLLHDQLWIPEDRAERLELADLAIKAAQQCLESAQEARANGDEIGASLHGQNAKDIFGDVVRLTISDMRANLFARYPNLKEDVAQDVLQDAYIKAYRGYPRFGHAARFHTWMYRITMNEASRRFRKHQRAAKDTGVDDLLFSEEHKHASLPATEYSGDKKRLLRELLNELDPDDRHMIWLRHVDDYTFPEIASMVGKKENTVKQRVRRALKKLREKIEERGLSTEDVLN